MDRMEQVRGIRANTEVHYNCCQSVLVPFAREMGLSEDQAFALGAHFGSGMRHGSACGVLSGGLMVLGALGYDESQALALLRRFQEGHGAADCTALLKNAQDQGISKKENCDGLVYEVVQALDELLQRG